MAQERNIPIKSVLEACMEKYGCVFPFEFTLLIRRFIIAGLNLGYYQPKHIIALVEAFCEKIRVVKDGNPENAYYQIDGQTLIINTEKEFANEELYEKVLFAAIFEVITDAQELKLFPMCREIICSMVGEKIYAMDVEDSRVIVPQTEHVRIGEHVLEPRAGYTFNKVAVCLFKQLCISVSVNENVVISKALVYKSLSKAVEEELLTEIHVKAFLDMFDSIQSLEDKQDYDRAYKTLCEYQIGLSEFVKDKSKMEQMAFLALILDSKTRECILKKLKS